MGKYTVEPPSEWVEQVLEKVEAAAKDPNSYSINYLMHRLCGGSRNRLSEVVRGTQRYLDALNAEAIRKGHKNAMFKEANFVMNARSADGRIVKVTKKQYDLIEERRRLENAKREENSVPGGLDDHGAKDNSERSQDGIT